MNIKIIHDQYLGKVRETHDIYTKLAECNIRDLIGEMKDLQDYVSLSNQLQQAVVEAYLLLETCFRMALDQYDIPLNQKILFKEMSGYFTIGETPSVFRPSLSAIDLAIDGLSILFVRDGDEDKPSNLKVRPVFRLEENNYKNPDVFNSGMIWLKKHVTIL